MRRVAYQGRFTTEGEALADVMLDERAGHYVTRVLRLREGTKIEVGDAGGQVATGTLVWRSGQPWVTALVALETTAGPARVLVAALIKQRRWEWLVEKATELGATELYPLIAARTVIKLPASKVSDRVARWQRMVDEAAKQCRRRSRLTVHAPISLDGLAEAQRGALVFFDTQTPTSPWPSVEGDLTLLVGPEGGWTDPERAQILALGASTAGLGPRVLRAETAALAALSHVALRSEVGGE